MITARPAWSIMSSAASKTFILSASRTPGFPFSRTVASLKVPRLGCFPSTARAGNGGGYDSTREAEHHGAPVVIDMDNGSAFIAENTRKL